MSEWTNQKEVLLWHIRLVTDVSAAVLARLSAPLALSQKVKSILSIPSSAPSVALALTLVPAVLSASNQVALANIKQQENRVGRLSSSVFFMRLYEFLPDINKINVFLAIFQNHFVLLHKQV